MGFSTAIVLEAIFTLSALHAPTPVERARYAWLATDAEVQTLEDRFPAPPGFHRVGVAPGSFGEWLRGLPLRPEGSPVRTFAGAVFRPERDPGVAAVAELDVGARDLQQCADSVIRLHAEWLWSTHQREDIAYHFTSGDLATWKRYAAGERAHVAANRVSWAHDRPADASRASFRAYLDLVFTYAGTLSLATHTQPIPREQLAPGDFFVLPARSEAGHAVLVLDVVEDGAGHRRGLIGEGYMPAQDFHIVASPEGAWISLDEERIVTPFWAPFPWSAAHRLTRSGG